MIIFPAIDIKAGNCVRLFKGKMDTAEKVAENVLDTALSFKADGAQWVHMVDLDGATQAKRVNFELIKQVVEESGLLVEVGGGIRTIYDIDYYAGIGVARIILGSAVLKNPELVKEAVKKYGDKIAVGIDAVRGKVAAEGWVEVSQIKYIDLAKMMEEAGVKNIIFTDIDRDGMLSGPNIEQLKLLNDAVSCNITASGGIKDIKDIKKLKDAGLYGAICGRSIYSGTLKLTEAISICK